jgi:hypothetical protein
LVLSLAQPKTDNNIAIEAHLFIAVSIGAKACEATGSVASLDQPFHGRGAALLRRDRLNST